jgi:hypothetical protein
METVLAWDGVPPRVVIRVLGPHRTEVGAQLPRWWIASKSRNHRNWPRGCSSTSVPWLKSWIGRFHAASSRAPTFSKSSAWAFSKAAGISGTVMCFRLAVSKRPLSTSSQAASVPAVMVNARASAAEDRS